MSKKKLFEDIKQNPARIYRTPADVLRDRRFGDAERLQILRAWRELLADPADRDVIEAVAAEVERRLCASDCTSDHAAE
jgi:hypothetical protein